MNAVIIRDACSLLHIVRDCDDREFVAQARHEFLDDGSCDRIERGRWFVHQQDFRLCRDGARDAKPLLLSTREPQRARAQLILHFVPKRGGCKARSAQSIF